MVGDDLQLKTSKDLKVSSKNPMFNMGADTQMQVSKAEAIKWVKDCNVRGKYGIHCKDNININNRCKACKRFIDFFNITEEDLK